MAKQDMPNLMQEWMQQQQKLWQDYAENLQQAGKAGQVPAAGLEQWRQAVEQSLETQKAATRAWADQIAAVKGAPDEVRKWADEGVRMLEQWSDAQRSVWQQWFDLMERSVSASANPAQQMMAGWEQMAAQMQSLQQQWARSFAPESGKPKKAASERRGTA